MIQFRTLIGFRHKVLYYQSINTVLKDLRCPANCNSILTDNNRSENRGGIEGSPHDESIIVIRTNSIFGSGTNYDRCTG